MPKAKSIEVKKSAQAKAASEPIEEAKKKEPWEAPSALVKAAEELIGKSFTLDAHALTKKSARAPSFLTPKQDPLEQPWPGVVWVSPPYGRTLHQWTQKAFDESRTNASVVCMLLPARTDTKFFHEVCTKGNVYLIRGRVAFVVNGKPILDGNGRPSPAKFPSMLAVFRKEGRGSIKVWDIPDAKD
jgi:hypothetical protein